MTNCTTCAGMKKIKGIGMMNVTCPTCKGSGLEPKLAPVSMPQKDETIPKPETLEKKKGFNENGK